MDAMNYTHPHGSHPATPQDMALLEEQNHMKCKNQLCNFMVNPETQQELAENGGSQALWDCPHCGWQQQPLLSPSAGGSTATGMVPHDQGIIGEQLVQQHGLGPYGPLLWWHGADPSDKSPIDGLTQAWAIEVKTTSINTQRVRGNIQPRDKPSKVRTINALDSFAAERNDPQLLEVVKQVPNLQGLLGVLVVLDVTTGLASIWAHEMPKDRATGIMAVEHIKHPTRKIMIHDNVPFDHPLPDTRDPLHVPHFQRQQENVEVPF